MQSALDGLNRQPREESISWLATHDRSWREEQSTELRLLLEEAWAIAAPHDPERASGLAWRLAWLLVRGAEYGAAAEWFGRIQVLPPDAQSTWSEVSAAQIALCRDAAGLRGAKGTGIAASTPDVSPGSDGDVHVHDLGRFAVTRARLLLPPCKARKAMALLRYLLTVAHHEAGKEELMEILWPDVAADRAAHSLHTTISLLRRYLRPPADGGAILHDGGRYRLDPAVRWQSDARLFRRRCDDGERAWRAGDNAAAERAYAEAIEGYHGDYFVDEHDLPWALTEQEALRTRHLTALERLANLAVRRQRHELALDWYQQLLARDNYREDIHSAAMRCYWRLGRRGDALRQYARCAQVLAEDLGVEPLPETRALYRTIANGQAPAQLEE